MYDRVDNSLIFARESKVIDFESEQYFSKTLQKPKASPSLPFYDGPPTANGKRISGIS